MDAEQALADLKEISTQVETVVIVDESGSVVASTLAEGAAEELAQLARQLAAAADQARPDPGKELVQLEVALREGSVFVVRHDGRTILATTGPDPTVGLVFYDLKSCLRSLDEEPGGDAAS
jgi:predicted regulator of Ras-like GTPase activity (Roadblock/LC7/MglB family)